MKCPVCNKEMEEGFVQGDKHIVWVKRKHKVSILPREGEVALETKVIGSFLLKAWICKSCKKVVVDYSDKDFKEG